MKEFLPLFASQIKEKFTKGIQFPQENPFQKQISLEKENSAETYDKPSHTYKELIGKCTDNLSFIKKKVHFFVTKEKKHSR
jgi:hypothetical protein